MQNKVDLETSKEAEIKKTEDVFDEVKKGRAFERY